MLFTHTAKEPTILPPDSSQKNYLAALFPCKTGGDHRGTGALLLPHQLPNELRTDRWIDGGAGLQSRQRRTHGKVHGIPQPVALRRAVQQLSLIHI